MCAIELAKSLIARDLRAHPGVGRILARASHRITAFLNQSSSTVVGDVSASGILRFVGADIRPEQKTYQPARAVQRPHQGAYDPVRGQSTRSVEKVEVS